MQELRLGKNSLGDLPMEVWANLFAGLSQLQMLDLRKNRLSLLPAEIFAGLGNLQELRLGKNSLGDLAMEVWANLFAGLSQLQKLDLRKNRLSLLPAEVFSGLGNLEELDLGYNSLGDLPFPQPKLLQVPNPAKISAGNRLRRFLRRSSICNWLSPANRLAQTSIGKSPSEFFPA